MKPFIVGIAGGTGSGKTTLVESLTRRLGPSLAVVIQHDSYYCPDPSLSAEQRAAINYDHPDSLETPLLVRHLDQLTAGTSVHVPVYDFTRHLRVEETRLVSPLPILIVEGILVFCDRQLRERMNLRVFVETEDDVRFIRRLRRDIEERGRTPDSVISQYLTTVKPMHQRYVDQSRRHAHLIIPGDESGQPAVEILLAGLLESAGRGGSASNLERASFS